MYRQRGPKILPSFPDFDDILVYGRGPYLLQFIYTLQEAYTSMINWRETLYERMGLLANVARNVQHVKSAIINWQNIRPARS